MTDTDNALPDHAQPLVDANALDAYLAQRRRDGVGLDFDTVTGPPGRLTVNRMGFSSEESKQELARAIRYMTARREQPSDQETK